jgi:hypothetical protein
MKKKQNHQANATVAMKLWTRAQALKAVPYLRAVSRSLREHWLTVRQARLSVERLDARPGPLDGPGRFLREELKREAEVALGQFEEAMNELMDLDVYSIDPGRGFALIPFIEGKELAWFVFDLFAPHGLVAWRFDSDPTETRRPLAETFDLDRSPALGAAEVDVLMSRTGATTDEWPAAPGNMRR